MIENLTGKIIEGAHCLETGQSQSARKTGRELWEEDQRRERETANRQKAVAPLVMGDRRMCEIGGCGYFSDDGK